MLNHRSTPHRNTITAVSDPCCTDTCTNLTSHNSGLSALFLLVWKLSQYWRLRTDEPRQSECTKKKKERGEEQNYRGDITGGEYRAETWGNLIKFRTRKGRMQEGEDRENTGVGERNRWFKHPNTSLPPTSLQSSELVKRGRITVPAYYIPNMTGTSLLSI